MKSEARPEAAVPPTGWIARQRVANGDGRAG